MNIKQAKQLDFPLLLSKLGYEPVSGGVRKQGDERWYKSPLSHENTASFHLSKGRHIPWVFKCFSTGKEGTIIDFVIAHQGYAANDIKSALTFLRDQFSATSFEPHPANLRRTEVSFSFHRHARDSLAQTADRDLEYLDDLPLKSSVILTYLEQKRKIPSALACRYLRLVRYLNLVNRKTYYALGMKNRAGGFEIRAAADDYSFKSALIARDITVVQGRESTRHALVFEGMIDFLSFLVMNETDAPPCDAVILHSVNTYQLGMAFLKAGSYGRIHTFLDNDPAGEKCRAQFTADFGAFHLSHSYSFAPYKDVNEALKAKFRVKFDLSNQNSNPDLSPRPDQ